MIERIKLTLNNRFNDTNNTKSYHKYQYVLDIVSNFDSMAQEN